MENLYLPNDTSEAKPSQIDNFALRLNKYPETHSDKFVIYHKYRENKRDKTIKANTDLQNSTKQILEFSARYLASLRKLSELQVEFSAFQPDWRLIIGLGSPSVYETSITLHHIYGFPYIPGQAVKGVTRNHVICEYFEKNEEKAENNEEFKRIFGTQEQKGKVIFFDAYPQTEPKLAFDIMNVHYPKYYSGEKEPTDDQNPNPITFLTVKDTTFFFPIGFPKNEDEKFTFKGKTVLEVIKTALEEKGIGAKSSVGYGFMKKDEEADTKLEADLEEYEQKLEKKRGKAEKQKMLEEMTELDKKLYNISLENDREKKRSLSMEIFSQIDTYSDAEKIKIALQLKDIWEELGIWKKQKKKQKEKVKTIADILSGWNVIN